METQDIEVRAKDLGWAPKEEFRGDPDKWVDAETFVKRGEEIMPILKANNKRMSEELGAVRKELDETKSLLKASAESIEALKEFNTALARKEAKVQETNIKEALKEAKREGDVDKEVELTEQLQEHREALKEAEAAAKKPNGKAEAKPNEEPDPTLNPDWKAWVGDNSWFGKDRRRTALAMGIAEELKQNPETAKLTGRAFLDKVSEEVSAVLDPRPIADKVEGGGRSSGGRGKGFADLPSDAKAACERQSERLVGPGRAFASQKEWRDHYAKQYFAEE